MIVFGHGIMLFVNALGRRIKNERGQRPQTGLPLSSETWVYRNISFCVLRPACRM